MYPALENSVYFVGYLPVSSLTLRSMSSAQLITLMIFLINF